VKALNKLRIPDSRTCSGWFWLAVLGLAGMLATLVWLRRRTDRATLQRRFWDVAYDRLAALYDAVDWFTGNTTHRLRLRGMRALPSDGARLLEIGFGSGKLHAELAGRYTLAGLDRAPGMVRLTRARLDARGLTSDLRVGDATALPWPDGAFDAVLSTFAFSAFPDADAALDEMVRVVKPGGKVIIVDAGVPPDGNPAARFLAWLWELFGDYIRDEALLLRARGLTVSREDYGPWGCVHVSVGEKGF